MDTELFDRPDYECQEAADTHFTHLSSAIIYL